VKMCYFNKSAPHPSSNKVATLTLIAATDDWLARFVISP
jgi:hypothetical protein